MKTVFIYNENFFFWQRIKNRLRFFFGIKRGPESVLDSLLAGLRELKKPYVLNQRQQDFIPLAYVLSGVDTLKWAIQQKQLGKIGKLVAGPAIAMPFEHNGIIFHSAIDIFLLPSKWVADFCENLHPGAKDKIRIWTSGVETLPESSKSDLREGCLIYKKNIDEVVFRRILQVLDEKKIKRKIINYGHYEKQTYFNLLRKSKFLIFLSQSESQGIALNEAWMLNTPTLVYNGGHLKNQEYDYKYSSAAPYLTEESGMFFNGADDFSEKLELFINNFSKFAPRSYHLKNFTNEIVAKNFVAIIKELLQKSL